jgi:hypothetical protein
MNRRHLTIINMRMASKKAFLVAIIAVVSLFATISPVDAADSVELRHVQPLLRRVAHRIERGFSRNDADHLAAEIRAMPSEQPMSWSFQVHYQGADHALEVRALLDELGTVDLDFSTSAALAPALRTDVDAYLNAHNL